MGNNSVLKFIFRLSRFPVYRGSVLGRFYCTKKAMGYWKTNMRLHTEGKIMETGNLEIKLWIFQGDWLSPLLFCINLCPLQNSCTGWNQDIKNTQHKQQYHIYYTIIIGIQPLGRSGQRPELSQATGMALVRCILGKFLGVVCHCFPPLFRRSHFSPPGASTSATTWEIPAAEVGTVGENVVR